MALFVLSHLIASRFYRSCTQPLNLELKWSATFYFSQASTSVMNYHLLNTVKPMQSIWQSYEGLVPYFPAACIGFGGIVPALFEASSVEDLPLVANYCYCVQTNF